MGTVSDTRVMLGVILSLPLLTIVSHVLADAEVASDILEDQTDDDIGGKLQEYVNSLEREKTMLEEFLRENNSHRPAEQVSPEVYVSHPVNSYNLLKRMSMPWRELSRKLEVMKKESLGEEI